MFSKRRRSFSKRALGIRQDASIFLKLARCATVTGRIEEAKLRLEHAIDLDENIRWLALHEEDLRPLWDWISGLE